MNKQIKSGSLISFKVSVKGKAIPGYIQVYSIHVERHVNRIATARILILDGSSAKEGFQVSSSDLFIPGEKVKIEAGYDSKDKVIFEGIIAKQTLRVDQEIGSALEVECKDEAIKMIIGRKSALFSKSKDSDVITKVIGTYSGLKAKVSSTSEKLPELVQYYASDWDFILTRAEANGMLVSTDDGTVSVFKPDKDKTPVLDISYGNNMYTFKAELNSVTQLSDVKASSWDYKKQALVSGEASNTESGPGNLSGKELSKVIGLSGFQLQTAAPRSEANLKSWAKAQMTKSNFSKIRGKVRFQGSSLAKPGKYITIGGMGKRFNGDHFLSGIVHEISDGNWFTDATLGISPDWFTQEVDVNAPPAAGLLPGASGLFNGTVLKIDEDPDKEFRIQVDVALFNGAGEGIWARLANFYSTKGAGTFFLPEVGDEVVLGFLNEDPRFPVILGSLYSDTITPFEGLKPNAENTKKAFVTKAQLRIEFDDENKVLTITTPGKNKIEFDDKEKQIRLTDQNENSIITSADGIAVKSPKTISLKSDADISISGAKGVSIESSSGDVEVSGMNIKETAQTEYTAKGSASATVDGGGALTLKAGMIKIN